MQVAKAKQYSSDSTPMSRPAITPDARDNQLMALATDLAEKQLREGTASSQVITHYLKMATREKKLELERMALENELTKAKTEAIKSAERVEALYADAINAMKRYQGQGDSNGEDYEY